MQEPGHFHFRRMTMPETGLIRGAYSVDMALSAKLQLRQAQSLVMTPQLLQSIRLLQFSHMELERFIDEEIERNPLLERADDENHGVKAETQDQAPDEPDQPPEDRPWTAEAISDRLDSSLENVFPDDPGARETLDPGLAAQWKSASQNASTGNGFDIDAMAAAKLSLRDHVAEQIAFSFPDSTDRMIATELADGLDEAGYLQMATDDVAFRTGLDQGQVERVLATCQGFDPAGIFARNLSECLALQLVRRDRHDPAMQAMVANLELLARRDFATLKKLCGVAEDDLLDMLAEIRALDPKPGLAFGGGTADTIVPDVLVKHAPDGSWAIELNPDTLPRVLVDQSYYARVAGRAQSQPEREFLAECMQSASWLTRSLDQRAKTILKVTAEIVRQQDAFLLHGVRHLRPLNLRTVAEAIGMHESTVSRVTANKFMMTPRGVFELRYFFTAAIASAEGGDAHSSEAVRDRIRALIAEEQASAVLSDDAIVDVLKKSGVDIARRTVAKYREAMDIPSSVQRRREKRAIAAYTA